MSCHDILASQTNLKRLCHEEEARSNLFLVEDVDQTIERWSVEIQCTTEHRRALRTHRNTLVPVSHIPNEIFRMVFRLCTPLSSKIHLAFSQICSQWRTLALNDPFLWRTPMFCHPSLLSEMLARAKDLPLAVREVCHRHVSKFEALRTILETRTVAHLNLEIDKYNGNQANIITRLLFKKLRLSLKSLDLEANGTCVHALLCSNQVENLLPFPLLRRLRLANCSLPGESQCYSNLITRALA
ncbi:hypothetical protein BC835DRAFT_277778 [Cytidiella melzeri]|nr:hypothetical protein BC835DRAFT_277778 [Cytidiella melzeri]